MKNHRLGKILLIGALVYALLVQFDAHAPRTSFWFLEWILLGVYGFGLWMGDRSRIRKWIETKGRRFAIGVYVLWAWLSAMAFELTLTRTGEGLGGNHQDSFASFVLSQGFYLPLILGALFLVWRYRLSFDRVLYVVAGFSLVEALISRPVLLATILSPLFFLTPVVLSYYIVSYILVSTLPLLFVNESVFWNKGDTSSTMGPTRLILLGFLIAGIINIFWGLVWSPAMEGLFGFPPVAEEVMPKS